MQDAKITINGVAVDGFDIVIEHNGGLASWRVVGELTSASPLDYMHSLGLGSEVLIRAAWRDDKGATQERVGWALFTAYDADNNGERATFTGNGPLFAPVGHDDGQLERERRDNNELIDECARLRERIAELESESSATFVNTAPHIHDVRTALAVAIIRAERGLRSATIVRIAREMANELTREDGEACQANGVTPSGAESARQSCDSPEPATDAGTGAVTT